MVPVLSLWVPILLSAAIVFIASSIIHMVLPFHRSDFRKLPDEDGTMDGLVYGLLTAGKFGWLWPR